MKSPISSPWPRRKLLGILASCGAVVTLRNFSGAAAFALGSDNANLAQRVVAILGHGHGAKAAMGAADKPFIGSLLAQILATTDEGMGELCLASQQVLRERIRSNVEADFRAGNITSMNGWRISHTEARCVEFIDLVCG